MLRPSILFVLSLYCVAPACQTKVSQPEPPLQEPVIEDRSEASEPEPELEPSLTEVPDEPSQPEGAELPLAERLEPLLQMGQQKELSPQDLAMVQAAAQSQEPALRAYSLLLLYREDPKAHWDELVEQWGVNDYAARARGEKDYLQADVWAEELTQIEENYAGPRRSVGPLLLAFLRYRDSNGWLAFEKGDVSVARFLRGAVLGSVLKQSAGLRTANRLDETMRAKAQESEGESEASDSATEPEVTSQDH